MNLLANISDLVSRLTFRKGITFNGKRDLYEIFGYPQELSITDFRDKYSRGDIAGRLVEAYPDACWLMPPTCVEDEDEDDLTPWEKQVEDFLKEIKFWQAIYRLDLLAQIGCYSILFIGYADTADLTQPVRKKARPLYLIPLAEDTAKVHSKVLTATDPRFGQPAEYKIKIEGRPDAVVHHSRILHVAERTLDNPLEGSSILKRVWNRLEDLEKTVGSSAEVFWLNGRGGLSVETKDGIGEIAEPEKMREKVDEYQHKLSRAMFLAGAEAKPLNHTVPDPKANFEVIISLISGSSSIPQRILLGSERGELASSQDDANWNKAVSQRKAKFCEPVILNAFIDRMIAQEVIPEPANAYRWEWPSLITMSEKDAAVIAKDKASAISTYAASPTANTIIPERQFVEEVLGMKYREDEILEILADEAKQAEADAKLAAENPIEEPTPKPKA